MVDAVPIVLQVPVERTEAWLNARQSSAAEMRPAR